MKTYSNLILLLNEVIGTGNRQYKSVVKMLTPEQINSPVTFVSLDPRDNYLDRDRGVSIGKADINHANVQLYKSKSNEKVFYLCYHSMKWSKLTLES